MCKAAPYLQGVAVCASVNTLAAIALDRYVVQAQTATPKQVESLAQSKRASSMLLYVHRDQKSTRHRKPKLRQRAWSPNVWVTVVC